MEAATPPPETVPLDNESAASSDVAELKARPPVAHASAEPPRLFILCGRDRKVEELREMFAKCGPIRNLSIATDRSKQSRGFAFLQYEDPSCASEAIKQFDKTTLSDGFLLKVSVAREKPKRSETVHKPAAPGKLKRNQHSQEDSDEKGDEGSNTDGGSLPGKRQRSSPPTSVSSVAMAQKAWARAAPFAAVESALRSADDEIADIVSGIVTQIERQNGEGADERDGRSTALHIAMGTTAKRKAPMALAFNTKEGTLSTSEEAASTSSAERMDVRPVKQKSQRTMAAQATPSRYARETFVIRQRRHVSIDESDSSLDETSDASAGRRKRSNTQPGDNKPEESTTTSSRRRLSDLSELSLSPAGISSPTISKKRCSRRSSVSSSTSSLPPFQVTPFRHVAPIFVPALPPVAVAPSPMRRRRNGPRAKLFFTSTVKYAEQELEAMFSIYEHFEYVQLVKSFGRLKTMAYVQYATPAAASSVLSSFLEDNEGDDHGMMKLVFADSDEPSPRFALHAQHPRRRSPSAAGESTSSEVPAVEPASDRGGDAVSSSQSDHCWLMLLYDRGLTNEALSSCVTECDGMEFMDIKMFRSTGESQGVAFVKFETEEHAQAASQRLHNAEFPVGSRKFLQAIVIDDPSLFSTPHGATATGPTSGTEPGPGEDGDLGFVEARFAHLMSGASEHNSGAQPVPAEDPYETERYSYSVPAPAHAFLAVNQFSQPGPPVGHGASPSYGYFQFGQPYPYSGVPPPHPLRQHAPFYPPAPHASQPAWAYDTMFPVWQGDTGGSPMQPDFDQFSWEPAASFPPFGPPHLDHCNAYSPASTQTEAATSVYISSSRALDLASLMKIIQDCPGVVGFSKGERDGVAFVVDFGEPRDAAQAASKLDGTMCSGTKLRVAVASGHRPPPSRRKRQRLDQRGRRK